MAVVCYCGVRTSSSLRMSIAKSLSPHVKSSSFRLFSRLVLSVSVSQSYSVSDLVSLPIQSHLNFLGVCSTHMLAMPKPSERSMFPELPRIDNNRHRYSGCANAHTMRRNVGQRIAGARRLAATKRHKYVPLAPAIKTRRGRRELANAPKKKRFVEWEQNQADEQTRKELGATSMGVWQY